VQPRILIAATSWIDNEYTLALFKLWYRVFKTLNKDEDFILIDACSPFDPRQHLPEGVEVFRWDENVGAISRGGKDGSGRSACKAIEIAIERGYDYVAIYETDSIFVRPIRPIFEKMQRSGVKVASPGLAKPYDFLEWSIWFLDIKYAKDTKFVERYDWEHTPAWPLVEMRLEAMFKDDLFILPFRGIRNEHNHTNVANIAQVWPYFLPDWMTHVNDLNLYVRWLDLLRITPE